MVDIDTSKVVPQQRDALRKGAAKPTPRKPKMYVYTLPLLAGPAAKGMVWRERGTVVGVNVSAAPTVRSEQESREKERWALCVMRCGGRPTAAVLS